MSNAQSRAQICSNDKSVYCVPSTVLNILWNQVWELHEYIVFLSTEKTDAFQKENQDPESLRNLTKIIQIKKDRGRKMNPWSLALTSICLTTL